MEDSELAAIRAARLQQLRQSAPANGVQGQGQSGDDSEAAEAEAKRAATQEQMRRDLLATGLDNGARERLARIALVSPQRSSQIESMLLRMAQMGQVRGRVSEEQLIQLLEQAEEAQAKAEPKKGTIVFQRRKGGFDDEDDFDF